jgi:hypothetical protein
METKVCSKCKEDKKVCEFGNSKSSKDGLLYCCKKCNNERSKNYVKENYQKTLEQHRKWTAKNPEWVYNRHKKWREENPEKIKEIRQNWLEKNPEKRLEYRKNYKPRKHQQRKERRKIDPLFVLTNNLRSRMYKFLITLNITKKNTTFEIVGCSPQELKEHLENKFVPGMSWENRAEWHIDHIIPLSSAKTEEELYILCHYTNLQPLWAEENLKKSNKILI